MWGLLSVGLFASPRRLWDAYENNAHPGLFYTWGAGYSDARLLGTNLIGLLFIVTWVSAFMFPFFIWLDWRGWFRSDPLEEIVGLDTSYHGGLFLMNGEDEVHPEYISAYKQKREGLRQRKPSNMMTTTASHDGSSLNAEHGNNSRSSAARRMMQQQHQHRVAGSRNWTHSDEEDGGPNDQDSNDDESDYEDENDYDHEQGSMGEHTPPEGMVRI
jgi:Ammonium Transporter Family